jgi:hypothetical protein
MADAGKNPLDQALDFLVYAPLGLAYTAMDELPNLVVKGRERFGNQMMVARMIGQFAFAQGQKEIEKAAERLAGEASTVAGRFGGFPGVPGPTAGATGAVRAAGSMRPTGDRDHPGLHDPPVPANGNGHAGAGARAAGSRGVRSPGRSGASAGGAVAGSAGSGSGSGSAAGSAAGSAGSAASVGGADRLAIPGYDSLSASQVVQRLAGLSGPELDAVGQYEKATRGRRTILSKVSQLQSDRR